MEGCGGGEEVGGQVIGRGGSAGGERGDVSRGRRRRKKKARSPSPPSGAPVPTSTAASVGPTTMTENEQDDISPASQAGRGVLER
jgi:hypothetical protein